MSVYVIFFFFSPFIDAGYSRALPSVVVLETMSQTRWSLDIPE